jgi:hypothetical protein
VGQEPYHIGKEFPFNQKDHERGFAFQSFHLGPVKPNRFSHVPTKELELSVL